MTPAAAFVARTAALPLVWGRTDCACWAASFVAEVTGRDPAAGLRGTYASAWECRRVVMEAGGLLALVRPRMAPLLEGGEGDGVAVAKVRGRAICGVLSGGRLVLKADRGLVMPAEYAILARWSL